MRSWSSASSWSGWLATTAPRLTWWGALPLIPDPGRWQADVRGRQQDALARGSRVRRSRGGAVGRPDVRTQAGARRGGRRASVEGRSVVICHQPRSGVRGDRVPTVPAGFPLRWGREDPVPAHLSSPWSPQSPLDLKGLASARRSHREVPPSNIKTPRSRRGRAPRADRWGLWGPAPEKPSGIAFRGSPHTLGLSPRVPTGRTCVSVRDPASSRRCPTAPGFSLAGGEGAEAERTPSLRAANGGRVRGNRLTKVAFAAQWASGERACLLRSAST